MTTLIPVFFAAVVGFGHAFEADHLVAVSSIVSKRSRIWLAVKDGIYWGLGHTSTIMLVGALMILGKMTIEESIFGYLEAVVGVMLIGIGLSRVWSVLGSSWSKTPTLLTNDESHHRMAYGVGLVHGLAGSGVMVLLVMTEIQDTFLSLLYLLIFGLGSVAGMLVASGIFSMPFSKSFARKKWMQVSLVLLSATFCLVLGGKIVFDNLFTHG